MNIFEAFNLQIPTEVAPVQKTKATKKPSKAKAVVSASSKALSLKNPLTLISGFYEDMVLTSEDFEGKTEVTELDIFAKLRPERMEYTTTLCTLDAVKDNTYTVVFKNTASQKWLNADDELKAYDKKYTISLAGYNLELDENVITLDVVKNAWESAYPEFGDNKTSYVVDESEGIIMPVFINKANISVDYPYSITVFGGVSHEITAAKDSDKKASYADIQAEVSKIYPMIKGFSLTAVENIVYVTPVYKGNGKAAAADKKKEVYPADTTISLVHRRMKVTPEDFGGKTEITDEDIFKFLREDYPEYSAKRCKIEYDKKLNFIILSYQSSKKGAPVFATAEEVKEYMDSCIEEYALCYGYSNGQKTRVEKTPVGLFLHDGSRGYFQMDLPQIPGALFHEILDVFRYMSHMKCGPLEAAAQIYYNKSKGEYFVYYPKQTVSRANVEFRYNMELEADPNLVSVMELHSHNTMHAFFSIQDNVDELATKLYLVVGNIDSSSYDCRLRAGCGGRFINHLSLTDIFDDDVLMDSYSECVSIRSSMAINEIRKKYTVEL